MSVWSGGRIGSSWHCCYCCVGREAPGLSSAQHPAVWSGLPAGGAVPGVTLMKALPDPGPPDLSSELKKTGVFFSQLF